MADDSIEVTDDMPFHPTDSPRGMHYYNMDILTNNQQKKLNEYKLQYIRNTEIYLNENPTIRALVAIIYRVVLRAQPKRNVHLTIAEYFSKPRIEIEGDVNDYLRKKSPQIQEFEELGDDIFSSPYNETEIDTVKYPAEANDLSKISDEEEDYSNATYDAMQSETDFMHSLVTSKLNATLEARPSATEEQLHIIKYQAINENLEELNGDVKAIVKSHLKEVPIEDDSDLDESEYIVQSEADGKVKDKARKKLMKKGSALKQVDVKKPEEEWLNSMSAEHAIKYQTILNNMASALLIDPEKSRKWYVSQMTIAVKQWKFLQAALHGNMSQDVQDALRHWQIALMDNTQDMSPEKKEIQMDWLEGHMTQGGTMSKSMVEILRLWQTQIILQGSVMTPEMIQIEIHKLKEDFKEIDKLPTDLKEEQSKRIDEQIKQMEFVVIMVHEIEELERQLLQNKIDLLAQVGYLTPQILLMQMSHLELYKKHGLLTNEEFEAKEKVIIDQMLSTNNITYETLIAHKKWIEWQLAERKLTPQIYNIQREFLNYQIGRIGITNSQILVSQMQWLESEMQNNFINKDAYESQKEVLQYRIAEQNKETIPKLKEQLNWLEAQLNYGNISKKKFDLEKATIQEKLDKLIVHNKTVEDLQYDLKLLQEEFGQGKVSEVEFAGKKKDIRERIVKLRQTTSQTLLAYMQILDAKLKAGGITQEEYDEKKLDLQRDKESDKILTYGSNRGSNISTILPADTLTSTAAVSPIQEQQTQNNIKQENNEDTSNQDRSQNPQYTDTCAASDVLKQEEEAANRTSERLVSIPIISPNSMNFQHTLINKKQSSEGVTSTPTSLPKTRRVSIRLSLPDLNEENQIYHYSLLEIGSADRKRSIRKLISMDEMMSQPETAKDPNGSPIQAQEKTEE